ncbi:hypothetical protein NG895_04400 [Aeoliella sp. ICT_H6.2]|uniref:Uncharacterized protein n=1 Tax=Aeoliella straminimaris TaxID=2954799 RepID=A0A9X2JFB7_9BACT|nr:hypothetical protein [Aeoliella straminimaris]MCO6043137.1 hypothetical protein [Aeoliella straminimaris]
MRTNEVQTVRSFLCRIPRLHPFTWCVVVMVLALLVLIVVPGEEQLPGPWREMTDAQRELCDQLYPTTGLALFGDEEVKALYTHGWPWPCVARGTFDPSIRSWTLSSAWPPKPPSELPNWLQSDNWPCQVDVSIINWRLLLLDVGVALLLLIATTTAVEWWIRRRGGLLKFRLADLIVGLTICGIVLGYIGYHVRLSRIEDRVGRHFGVSRDGGHNSFSWSNTYLGPEWLTRLVGHKSLPALFYHHDFVLVRWDYSWADDVEQLTKLKFVKVLRVSETSPRSAIEQLKTLPRLRELQLGSFSTQDLRAGEAQWAAAGDAVFRPQDLSLLGQLELETLWLRGDGILVEDVEQLLTAAPTLEELTLTDMTATNEEVKTLRERFPEVTINSYWESDEPYRGTLLETSPHTDAEVEQAQRERAERASE